MATATVIDGKHLASKLRAAIAIHVDKLKKEYSLVPGLAVLVVGKDPASQIYVRNKSWQALEVGMHSFQHTLPETVPLAELLRCIDELNHNHNVNGILVQLPLPKQIDTKMVIEMISVSKDIDGFHPLNTGLLVLGGVGMIPCTPMGCLMLLKQYLGELASMRAVILGRSNIVGKPMATMLLRENCTVTIAHSYTREIAEECRRADILVSAIGNPQIVKGDWLKPGSTVIDVGINRISTRYPMDKLVGDVDFASAVKVAGAITPVPGGVGPMTIACLLLNTLIATCRQNGISEPKITLT
jgi:methylenetetrahydrofolate dehydrogenase (NADP+)/methenyltetrahydrofolate cyclohydrolase